MNTKLLKCLIKSKGDTQETLAHGTGIPPSSLCYKINNKLRFTVPEVIAIAKWYKLTGEELLNIFFPEVDA